MINLGESIGTFHQEKPSFDAQINWAEYAHGREVIRALTRHELQKVGCAAVFAGTGEIYAQPPITDPDTAKSIGEAIATNHHHLQYPVMMSLGEHYSTTIAMRRLSLQDMQPGAIGTFTPPSAEVIQPATEA